VPKSFRIRIDGDEDKRETSGMEGNPGENAEQTAEEIAEIIAEDAGAAGVDVQKRVSELEDELQKVQSDLESAKRDLEEEHNHYLRSLADFSNFKRRRQEEFETQVQFANQELILKLLPVIDNFERALQASQVNHNFDALAEGVSLTLRQLKDMLEREGVEPIEAVGQEFDPMIHEAVMRIESDEYPENTVVEELEKGYTQRSRVIRPSRVKVATR
jgi:molecular chaperone GrpE